MASLGASGAMTATQRAEAFIASARRARRWRALLAGSVLLACILVSAAVSEVRLDAFLTGYPRFTTYLYSILPKLHLATLGSDIAEWFWGIGTGKWLGATLDTLLIAFLASLIASCGAFLVGFVAARNTTPQRWLGTLVRRALEFARTVPDLVFALMFVAAFGSGPLAGVLAIVIAEIGILAKLFSEAIEAADPRPVEGVRAAGGSALQRMRFGLFPQVLPNFLSLALYQFESNTRSATILGMVGAGGIGLLFAEMTRTYEWPRVGTLLIAVWLAVATIDWAAGKLRRALVAGRHSE